MESKYLSNWAYAAVNQLTVDWTLFRSLFSSFSLPFAPFLSLSIGLASSRLHCLISADCFVITINGKQQNLRLTGNDWKQHLLRLFLRLRHCRRVHWNDESWWQRAACKPTIPASILHPSPAFLSLINASSNLTTNCRQALAMCRAQILN